MIVLYASTRLIIYHAGWMKIFLAILDRPYLIKMSTDKSPKKYIVVDHITGTKYEVTEHVDKFGYIHKNPKPINNEVKPEVKPVSFKDIERLYKKEFPESQSQAKPKPNVNEIKRLHEMLNER